MFKLVLNRRADYLASSTAARIFPNASWHELAPNYFLNKEDQVDSHCIELVSVCRGDEPGIAQDHGHAWIRLTEPSGAVYSVGFYPDESTNVEPDEVPGLRMPGLLLTPDKYEKHYQKGWNCRAVRYFISESCFDEAKLTIETMQKNRLQGSLAFDLCEYNCVNFVIKIAAICGVTIQADTSLSRLADDVYFSGKLQSLRSLISYRLPSPLVEGVGALVYNIRSIFFNLALTLFGGFSTLRVQWINGSAKEAMHSKIENLDPIFLTFSQVWLKRVPFFHVREFRKWQLGALATPEDAIQTEVGQQLLIENQGE